MSAKEGNNKDGKEINRNLKVQKRTIKPRAVPWKNKQNL